MNTYSYARFTGPNLVFFRVRRSGLGNLLFAWARSIVTSTQCGLTPIYPTWRQATVRGVLGIKPLRYYGNLFQRPPGYVGGVRKQLLLASLPTISESEFHRSSEPPGGKIVVFRGFQHYHGPILGDHELVSRELTRMVRPRHLPSPPALPFVGVHVRLGDFTPSDGEGLAAGLLNRRLPLGWYVDMVKQVRWAAGRPVPVRLFSDGDREELRPLLQMEKVEMADRASAVTDLLALSYSAVLIASGSTFSMWASFLGRMPVIWYPRQIRLRLYTDRPEIEIEQAEGQTLPPRFQEQVRARFR